MYILSHNSLERGQVQALTMYFIITTMAWSRCRRRLEREEERGAQGPAERRHERRVSQAARQRDLRAIERELRGERNGRGAKCAGSAVTQRLIGAAGPQEEPERARAEGYGTPREHGSAGCARRRLPDEVQRIQHQCCERAARRANQRGSWCGPQSVIGESSSA